MKLPRPYIPYSVRVEVAARQALAQDIVLSEKQGAWPYTRQLRALLFALFGKAKVHLDHDPPLMLRQNLYHNGNHVAYSPSANDPNFLIYRKADDHRIKTYVKGDGAQRSDVSQRRYLKRVAKNRSPQLRFKPRKVKHVRKPHASLPTRHGEKTK